MKTVNCIVKSILISPELLVCLSVAVVYYYFQPFFLNLSIKLQTDGEVLRYLGLLPIALMVYTAKTNKKILFPSEDKKRIMQRWDDYYNLKTGALVGLCYGLIFAGLGIVSLLSRGDKGTAITTAFLLTSILGGFTVSGTFYLADIKIEELFRKHSNQKSNL